MSADLKSLTNKPIWKYFSSLCDIPRPSKNESKAVKYLSRLGEELGLETIVDKVGNVIIKKPGSKGMEKCMTIILQGHIDMVPQKNKDKDFNFNTDSIEAYIDGDWVKADGTTLGADNGIGVAAALAILESKDIKHPPIEALFTVDEETGMTGAMNLQPGMLEGKVLLNLDSEDDTELTIGCAGGIDISAMNIYEEKAVGRNAVAFQIEVRGLMGGHSGIDIHLGRGNANKIMNRILWKGQNTFNLNVAEIQGGGLRNAIPRESISKVVIKEKHKKRFKSFFKKEVRDIRNEFKTTDPKLELLIEEIPLPKKVMKKGDQRKMLYSVYCCPNGIYRMSPDIDDLVQTSNNLARVKAKNGKIEVHNLTRSAVDSEKMDMAYAIQSCFELAGARVKMEGGYPGWAPDPNAKINRIISNQYNEIFGSTPHILACHAGLECGIIKESYPDVEMISFGPNIRGPHSPDEKVQISSVDKFWKLLLNVLENIPEA